MKSSFLSSPRALFAVVVLVLAPLAAYAQQTINASIGQVGVAYTYQVSSNATPPVIFGATGLPGGLAINTSSGLITGIPTTAGTATGSISITNSSNQTNTATIVIVISQAAGASAITSGAVASGTVGVGTFTYTITGSNSPTSFNVGALPAGLAVNTTSGVITGTPAVAGIYPVVLSANNTGGTGAPATLTITIAPAVGAPVINSQPIATASTTAPFSYQITATNSPTSYAASGLPFGLSLITNSGAISGTATVPGIYLVTLTASGAGGTSAPFTLTLSVGSLSVISSATAATVNAGNVFSYTITASNTPTSFNVGPLPAGLTINTSSGAINGTPTTVGVTTVALSANNATGTGPITTLTITVASPPVISSALAASGTAGSAFNYLVTASNAPTSFNVGALPGGLTFNSLTSAIAGNPATAGVTSVTLSATNATGAGPSVTLVITINAAAAGGGTVVVGPPAITAQPQNQSAAEGSSVSFSVSATGSGLNFQWSKDGTSIPGAQSATYTISSVKATDAGAYAVYIYGVGGALTSTVVTLTVGPSADVAARIATQPVATTATSGGTASFSVVATGTAPVSYQWRKNGVAIAGATTATLSLTGVSDTSAGTYSVVVTNSAGSATSNGVALTVTPSSSPSIAGTYFGSFAGNGGSFGLLVRSDRTGVFLGFASASKVALLNREIVVDASGRFSGTQRGAAAELPTTNPPTAAADGDVTINGTIAADGTLSGSVSTLNLSFSAPAAAKTGSAVAVAGFYQAGAAGSSAQSLALVSPSGDALVVNITGATADGGRGTATAAGAISVTTSANTVVTGTISASAGTITATATSATGAATTYAGSTDNRNEKLINISTRSLTGTATDTLIAGFVITGTESKSVLVRAIGPTLTTFGVSGALSAARLEVFRGQTSLAVGTDWGAAANNPATVTATAARVGAFALQANSRDAALLMDLTPGSYTAVVTGQGGASGVALVEVYDATAGAIPLAQRVVNIATRAGAGTGDNTLIAGFYVSGTVPKRVLIRGIGPSLAQFGVAGVLARPQLSVASGATVLAQNAGVATSADAAAIAAASAQTGAFALAANAQDAAILINLAPGAYTAQVSGVGATTGVALIEVYEVP